VTNRIQAVLHLKRCNAKDLVRASSFKRETVFSGLCAVQAERGSVFSESQFSARASGFEFSVGAVLNASSFPLISKV
jgi:hypothetical protein